MQQNCTKGSISLHFYQHLCFLSPPSWVTLISIPHLKAIWFGARSRAPYSQDLGFIAPYLSPGVLKGEFSKLSSICREEMSGHQEVLNTVFCGVPWSDAGWMV